MYRYFFALAVAFTYQHSIDCAHKPTDSGQKRTKKHPEARRKKRLCVQASSQEKEGSKTQDKPLIPLRCTRADGTTLELPVDPADKVLQFLIGNGDTWEAFRTAKRLACVCAEAARAFSDQNFRQTSKRLQFNINASYTDRQLCVENGFIIKQRNYPFFIPSFPLIHQIVHKAIHERCLAGLQAALRCGASLTGVNSLQQTVFHRLAHDVYAPFVVQQLRAYKAQAIALIFGHLHARWGRVGAMIFIARIDAQRRTARSTSELLMGYRDGIGQPEYPDDQFISNFDSGLDKLK